MCAYLRDIEPSTPSVDATAVAAPLDRQLHDVLGIEIGRVGRERSAAGVLDALVDRKDRDISGAGQPSTAIEPTQAHQNRRRTVGTTEDLIDMVGARLVDQLLGDALALVIQQALGLVSEELDDAIDLGRGLSELSWWLQPPIGE